RADSYSGASSPQPSFPSDGGEGEQVIADKSAFARAAGISYLQHVSTHWSKISVIGVGLLGGSIGLAVRQRRLADRVIGYVRRADSIAECIQAGAVDDAFVELDRAVEGADLVILCTPLSQMGRLVEKLAPHLKRSTIITDVGSVKGTVI